MRFTESIRFHPAAFGIFISPVYFLRRSLDAFIKKHAAQMDGKVADIGCGSKPYQQYFINADSYTGFDIASNEKTDIVFDGKNLPVESATYNHIISSEVLEHVFWPKLWLAEINRALKPGGLLLLTGPFMFHEHEAPYDYGRYSSYGLKYLLQEAGFETVEFKKAVPGLQCILLQWNVLWWTTFKKHLPRPIAFALSWPFFFPANIMGLLLGWCWKSSGSFYTGNMVLCKKSTASI